MRDLSVIINAEYGTNYSQEQIFWASNVIDTIREVQHKRIEINGNTMQKSSNVVMCKIVFGHSELKQFNRFENGRMVSYECRIDYDQDGNETGRTEPEAISSIGWDDGSPFTEIDYLRLST